MYVQAISLINFITQLTRKFLDSKNKGKDQRPHNTMIMHQISMHIQSAKFVFKHRKEYIIDINNFTHYLCLSVNVHLR